MAWLVRDGEVLATLEVVESVGGRMRGLLGRDNVEGAVLLRPARSVHTVGMRFPIDVAYVAYVDDTMSVLRTVQMKRWRLGRPVMKARGVIEAEAGAFAMWNLRVGDLLEIKG